jgi:hypothetical protein
MFVSVLFEDMSDWGDRILSNILDQPPLTTCIDNSPKRSREFTNFDSREPAFSIFLLA